MLLRHYADSCHADDAAIDAASRCCWPLMMPPAIFSLYTGRHAAPDYDAASFVTP